MNDLFQNLGEQLKGSSGGTKFVAVIVCFALIVVIGGVAVVTNGPDYQLTFSGLSDHEFPRVTKALADAGIGFQTSQPPAPFSVFVDADERTGAYSAAFGAGALDKPLRGIMAEGGVASVFSSSAERKQGVRKREWGEIEKMLEVLDFVQAATVRTSAPANSALPSRNAIPTTASVTLRIVDNAALTSSQSETVANLVSRGLGISKENLVLSDQAGKNLYDGNSGTEELRIKNLFSQQGQYDAHLTEIANMVLKDVLGPRKALVTINSEWDYTQTTTSREEAIGSGAMIMESKQKTDRTIPSDTGEAVGISANTLTGSNSVVPTSPNSEPMKENTSDEKKEFVPTISREDKVDYVPRLERLSVALFLDHSLSSEEVKLEELEAAIKASVGFMETRDVFSSAIFPFASNDTPAAEGTPAAESELSEPNPMIDKLLRHGLEIGTGLIFLTLLLRSFRKGSAVQAPAGGRNYPPGTPMGGDIDPEILARLKVEQMLESEPAKLGDALTRWIQEDEPVEAKK